MADKAIEDISLSGDSIVEDKLELHPSLWHLGMVWAKISIISFGGGSATILLIRKEFIDKSKWVTEEEYQRYWSLCQLSPGVILFSMIILIGRKLRGWQGIVVSLLGLLLPSSVIICILSALFAVIQVLPPVQAMVQGFIPATAGMLLSIAVQFALPEFKGIKKKHWLDLVEAIVIILGSCIALIWGHLETVLVVAGAVAVGVGIFLPLRHWLGIEEKRV